MSLTISKGTFLCFRKSEIFATFGIYFVTDRAMSNFFLPYRNKWMSEGQFFTWKKKNTQKIVVEIKIWNSTKMSWRFLLLRLWVTYKLFRGKWTHYFFLQNVGEKHYFKSGELIQSKFFAWKNAITLITGIIVKIGTH